MGIIENGPFKFEFYESGLRVGVNAENSNDHNGLKDDFVETITDIIIPSQVAGFNVVALGYRCFRNLSNTRTAFIPKTVTELQGDTFMFNSKLEIVTFEEGSELSKIFGWEFLRTNLITIHIPPGVDAIGPSVFYEANNFKYLFYYNLAWFDPPNFLINVHPSLIVFVPSNYPHSNFSGRPVLKTLPPFNGIYRCLSASANILSVSNSLSCLFLQFLMMCIIHFLYIP